MNDNNSSVDDYKRVLEPTGTARSAPNRINTLTAHLGEPKHDHPQYTQPTLSQQDLGQIANALADRGAYAESARIEIERRHMVSQREYAPCFTTYELTAITIQLVGVKIEASLFRDSDVRTALNNFINVIDDSDIAPLDERYDGLNDESLRHVEGDYLDPFRAVGGVQTVLFTHNGCPITLSEDNTPVCGNTPISRSDLPTISVWTPPERVA